jgi:hypothetical protein
VIASLAERGRGRECFPAFFVSGCERWNSPYINHFIQPDSIIPEESQGVQAWDRYAYANNNPVRYTDPSGHNVPQPCWYCNRLWFNYSRTPLFIQGH